MAATGVDDRASLVSDVKMSDSEKTSLADKVQSAFDAAMGNEVEEVEQAEETTEETPAEGEQQEETTTAEESAEEQASEEQAGAKTETKAEAADGKSPTLPAAYRRSLKAYEWTDEEIDANLKAFGPSFITTAAKIHANRNQEVQRWAAEGRKAKEQSAQPNKDTAQKTETEGDGALPLLDVTALKEQYGDDTLIEKIVGPVNKAIERLNKALPVVQQTQTQAQLQQAEIFGRQIDGFFGGKDIDKEVYGAETAKLNETQYTARQKVLEFADALVHGAQRQGRTLSFDEAMQSAYDAVSGGTKEQAARKAITKTMQARNKGLTLKPGAKGAATVTTGARAKNRDDLEKNVIGGLKRVFG